MERSKSGTWAVQGDFGVLTIDNPPQNYLSEPEFVELSALQKWTDGQALKGVVVTGKGRHFCAGVDQKSLFKAEGTPEKIEANLRRGKAVIEHLFNLPIPTVAAIEGVCLGGGLEVALACHVRIASKKALFSFPETSLGVLPGLYGTVLIPSMVGMSKSMELALAGETINAEEAQSLGIVDQVVPGKEAFAFAMEYLKKITAEKPMHVIHAVVRSAASTRRKSFEEGMEDQIKLFCDLVLKRKAAMTDEQ